MNITAGKINYAVEDGRNDLCLLESLCQRHDVNEKIKAIKKRCSFEGHTHLFMSALEIIRIVSEAIEEGGHVIIETQGQRFEITMPKIGVNE